jgi:hypothetical protein
VRIGHVDRFVVESLGEVGSEERYTYKDGFYEARGGEACDNG